MKQLRAAEIQLGKTLVAVVQVPSYVVHSQSECQRLAAELTTQFDQHEIVLAAMVPPRAIYYGAPGLVAQIKRLPTFRIHWREYRFETAPNHLTDTNGQARKTGQ